MARLNAHFLNLSAGYLFSEIRRRTKAFTDAHPDARLINLGIGDVTRPLPPVVVRAPHAAVDELAHAETFKDYGPYTGGGARALGRVRPRPRRRDPLRRRLRGLHRRRGHPALDLRDRGRARGGDRAAELLQERGLHRPAAGLSSWDFFDRLLAEAHVVGVPGSGFGPSGEGYFRLTAFGSHEQTEEAVERIKRRAD